MEHWSEHEKRAKLARESAYRLQHPRRISGEPTMVVQVRLGGQGGIVPLLQWVDTYRPPLGRYACFWIGD